MPTFLFTDIEGSTRLWEQYPTAMSAAIARHERILRDAIEVHGGSVFNTAGDSVCAVFASPGQAMAAAVEGQRGLLAEVWNPDLPELRISVRMAIDTGDAQASDGNFLGPALNQLHRLMKTGHGGQILCGSTVAEAVSGEGIVSLRYLGSHALRDVSGETRIFQIEAHGLPGTFPRLIVDRPPSTRLPYHPAALFGREADLQRIGTLLRDRTNRLVTLLGPGGVGKTTLAVALARQLDEFFPDGAHFVDLSALRDVQLVVPAIAGTLQIEDPLLTPEDALIAGLRSRELLLVLDNCEQVVEEVARLTSRLSAETSGVTLLATSRTPLRIAPEREERIEPFPLPDQSDPGDNPAVQLFREHASQVNAHFQLTTQSRPAVVQICRLVDGLPLAIELAAAWVRILDPATLRDRLVNGAPLLRSDARDRPERHRTLTSTIDWSYQLLDPDARAAFGRLAVFQGGIPLDGALAVLQAGERATFIDALEQLDCLVQANLLQPPNQTSDGPRYAMLQTIREFALAALSPPDRLAASRAHAEYFASMAASAEQHYRGPEASVWFDRLDANIDNLRAAINWLAMGDHADPTASLLLITRLWEYVDTRGRQPETRALLATALDAAGDAPSSIRAQALAQLGNAWLDNFEQAETFYRRSLEAAKSADSRWQMAAMVGLGTIASNRGDHETASRIASQIVDRARATMHSAALAQALLIHGHVLEQSGRSRDALDPLRESRQISSEIGDSAGVAWARKLEARALESQGELDSAELLLRRAISDFETVGERVSIADCQLSLSRILLDRNLDESQALLAAAIGTLLQTSDLHTAIEAVESGALYLETIDQLQRAVELAASAEAIRATSGLRSSIVLGRRLQALADRTMCTLDQGSIVAARQRGHNRSIRDALISVQEFLMRAPTLVPSAPPDQPGRG